MFINENYKNYKYVVSASDNYVVLYNHRTVNASWDSPETIDVVYQYLNPSFLTIESQRTFTTSQTFNEVDSSQSFFARADSLDLIKVQVIIIFMILFFFNGLTKFVRKGGVIFGN